MRNSYIPDHASICYPDQPTEQLGEPYLLYEWKFIYQVAQGRWWLSQRVSVSFAIYGDNLPLLFAGSCVSSDADLCFLHVDTIGELVRICRRQFVKIIQQQLLDATQES